MWPFNTGDCLIEVWLSSFVANLNFTTKFNNSSISITIIPCDYLNLSLANEYVGNATTPTQVIKYNQNFLQVDQPIRYTMHIQKQGIGCKWKTN